MVMEESLWGWKEVGSDGRKSVVMEVVVTKRSLWLQKEVSGDGRNLLVMEGSWW